MIWVTRASDPLTAGDLDRLFAVGGHGRAVASVYGDA
jgi:hypothetical protein